GVAPIQIDSDGTVL
ncbi:MAG TPA: hypothetical protein DCE56_39785, partial [Cyanobacteria bacterium UBA8553]|nr:hypothetical protein [Cyanobacteria bacterium UBA8553]